MTKKPDSAVFSLKSPDMFQTSSLTKGEQTNYGKKKQTKQTKRNKTGCPSLHVSMAVTIRHKIANMISKNKKNMAYILCFFVTIIK